MCLGVPLAKLSSPKLEGKMRLSEAKLCEDCKEVFITKRCPLCGRESYSYIARWLDRMPNPLEIANDPNAGKMEIAMIYQG